MDEFRWEWTVFKSNYPLTSISRQKIHIICRCIPCQAINCTWSGIRNFPQTRKNQPRTRTKLHFPSTCQQMDASRQEACDVHVHRSWCRGPDTVKRPLEAPMAYFDSRLGTYIYVQESQRVWDFVRIFTYGTTKGLNPWTHGFFPSFILYVHVILYWLVVSASSGSDQSYGLKMTYNPVFVAATRRDPSCDSVTSLVSAGTAWSGTSPMDTYQRPHSITSKWRSTPLRRQIKPEGESRLLTVSVSTI